VGIEENKDLVRRLHAELLASGDVDMVERFFAEDFVSYDNPPGFPPGVEGVKRFFETFRDALDDIEVRIDELVAEDDRVAVATTTTGRHTGELLGHPPTGKPLEIGGIDLVRIHDGRIVEHRGLTDTVGLLRQLGA
jgi:steroid delta-isomerase-like uncharacterized protein